MKKFNQFHLVEPRPWPLTTSLCFFNIIISIIIIFSKINRIYFLISTILLIYSAYLWRQDIHRERCLEGSHQDIVVKGFKFGIVIFILSECFFFFAIFWSYLHLAQTPAIEIGGIWPPKGIITFDPKGIPFFNTIILVSSGVSVTWSHHSFSKKNYKERVVIILITIFLGITFTALQAIEYYVRRFTIACSSYSSIYYLGTGFHGTHVIIGRILLMICFLRIIYFHTRVNHTAMIECSIWYWHFVDVVWFFLYLIFYWWGV